MEVMRAEMRRKKNKEERKRDSRTDGKVWRRGGYVRLLLEMEDHTASKKQSKKGEERRVEERRVGQAGRRCEARCEEWTVTPG